jgi:hypothetical protein
MESNDPFSNDVSTDSYLKFILRYDYFTSVAAFVMKFSNSILLLSIFQLNNAVVTGFILNGPRTASFTSALSVGASNEYLGSVVNGRAQEVRWHGALVISNVILVSFFSLTHKSAVTFYHSHPQRKS